MGTAIFGFVLGICIGSFLNVNIDRLPRGQSLVYPASHCAACGQKLKVFELIPLLSYLGLKGKCRHCGVSIPRRLFAVELGTGLLFALIALSYGFSIESLVLAGYTSLFIILAMIDLEHGLILNKITYPTIGLSLVLAPFWSDLGFARTLLGENTRLDALMSSLTGGTIFAVFFLLIVLLYRGSMGWGDVKMAGLVGLVTGFPSVLVAMMIAFVSGGMVASALLLLRRKGRRETMPFAPFLSLGAVAALLWGADLVRWYLGQ